jgi:hypothetical protein
MAFFTGHDHAQRPLSRRQGLVVATTGEENDALRPSLWVSDEYLNVKAVWIETA